MACPLSSIFVLTDQPALDAYSAIEIISQHFKTVVPTYIREKERRSGKEGRFEEGRFERRNEG